MKRVLVTGSNGQLGLTLEQLSIDYKDLFFDFKTSADLDITDVEHVRNTIRKDSYDYCINCAAYTNVELAETEIQKAFQVNAEGVRNLAAYCKEYNLILIHISTDYIFDGTKGEPYIPDDVPNPINEYGKSKLEGERHIQDIMQSYYIVRTSWLYSKSFGKNFYRTILNKAKKGEQLKVTDKQKGCPTSTISLSKFIIDKLILNSPKCGIYHFTDGETMSWYDFAKRILAENDISIDILKKYNSKSEKVNRPINSVLTTTKKNSQKLH